MRKLYTYGWWTLSDSESLSYFSDGQFLSSADRGSTGSELLSDTLRYYRLSQVRQPFYRANWLRTQTKFRLGVLAEHCFRCRQGGLDHDFSAVINLGGASFWVLTTAILIFLRSEVIHCRPGEAWVILIFIRHFPNSQLLRQKRALLDLKFFFWNPKINQISQSLFCNEEWSLN